MNIFIDTNVYLTFYHFSDEDLEELKKILVTIGKGKMTLWLSDQVKFEFQRNREIKIADALKRFEDQKIPNQFPQICKEYEEYDDLRSATKSFDESRQRIVSKLKADIYGKSLRADKVINLLFAKAEFIKTTDVILEKAKRRCVIGNPPGKNGSYGDAINWEILLEVIPKGEKIYFISDDKDYASKIDEKSMSQFLVEEWEEKKESKIIFYRKLSSFFEDKFPNIKLAVELRKEMDINDFIYSRNYANTHHSIMNLSRYGDFSNEQINNLVKGAITNSQIWGIRADSDVREFCKQLIAGKEDVIDASDLAAFKKAYVDEEKIPIVTATF